LQIEFEDRGLSEPVNHASEYIGWGQGLTYFTGALKIECWM